MVKASLCRVYSCSDRPFFKVIVALVVFLGTMAVRNGVVVVLKQPIVGFCMVIER